MTIRDDLRSAFLGTKDDFKTELIVINGQTLEIREPSAGKRAKIIKAAGAATILKAARGEKNDRTVLDIGLLQCHAIAELVFIPGTNDNVFGVADFEAMLAKPAHVFDELNNKVSAIMNLDAEDLEKLQGNS